MNLTYTVSKEKGGKWYAHAANTPHLPISGSHGDKKRFEGGG